MNETGLLPFTIHHSRITLFGTAMRLILLFLLMFAALARGAEPELLEPEKAFRFEARLKDERSIEIHYRVAPGYYLYRDKFHFAAGPEGVKLGAAQFPAGRKHRDEFFGEVETYRGDVSIVVPFELTNGTPAAMALSSTSQGCADAGVCYIPYEHKTQISLAGGPVTPRTGAPFGGAAGEDDRVAALLGGGFWLAIVSFFGFGLLLSFTPCVLPMVPILSSVIVGSGRHVTRGKGLWLAAAYVLGMAVTYAAAGVAAGLSGSMLSATLQNPWVVGAFAALFVVLAASMFGFYELQLPVALQGRLAAASNRFPGGHSAGVFVMGALSALILGPCVAAPLAGALLYIGQSRDVVLGGAALFSMALGMGVPLLAIGASAGALLPKAGPWMETVNRFFGSLLLGVAIYLVSPFITVQVQLFLWGALLIGAAVALRVFDSLPSGAHPFQRISKAVGVVALLGGVAYLVGAFSGGRDVLQPLSGLRGEAAQDREAQAVSFQRVGNLVELDAAIAAAAGRPVMLDFYADWCISCKEMERFTFSDGRVRSRFRDMVLLQADVTAGNADHAALLKRFRLFGPPGIVFFDPSGREIPGLRVVGYQPADRFIAVLDRALAVRPVN